MKNMLHSLLNDPVISLRLPDKHLSASLPEVFALLGHGEGLEFAALRAHQRHAWHAFLVQLGALAACRWQDTKLDRSAADWRSVLLDLSGKSEDAWSLVVTDLSLPAFMQPPVPEGDLDSFKNLVAAPDELDVLITAKNHDEKQGRINNPRPEHWIYALVTLQTMEGFLGRGNYGIARMNGGFASRPGFGVAPRLDWSARFCRDVGVWIDEREALTSDDFGYRNSGAPALLWLLPWGGKAGESLALSDLDPFFIEICRRVRMCEESGDVVARVANTNGPRVDAKQATGRTGDIWTPVASSGKALTVSGRGFHYRLLADLLLGGDYPDRARPASRVRAEDGQAPYLVAEVLTRGQGKTDGYHERVIPIPPKVRRVLRRPEERASLAELAQRRIDVAATAQRRVLHPALCALLQGGSENLKFNDDRTRPWVAALDADIDKVFFQSLWRDADPELESDEANRRWESVLWRLTQKSFNDALRSAPVPRATRPRAEAKSEMRLRGLARKHLAAAFAPSPMSEEGIAHDEPHAD